jgi:hypothetical protein
MSSTKFERGASIVVRSVGRGARGVPIEDRVICHLPSGERYVLSETDEFQALGHTG